MGLLRAAFDAFLATCFTWFVTACGAALVFILPSDEKTQRQILQPMLGFAGGVMTSASFFSLLAPALEMSQARYGSGWAFFPVTVGFAVGCCCMLACDQYMERHGSLDPLELMQTKLLSGGSPRHGGKKSDGGWSNSPPRNDGGTTTTAAGRAVGVGFGGAAADLPGASRAKALNLALGIGLQNFPEGLAVSMPLRRSGMPASRAFLFGQLSGVVEPVGGVLGAALVLVVTPVLPYALAFAAGAMIYVVVDQLIPESLEGAHSTTGNKQQTLSFLFGFGLMMTLDVALG